MSNYKSELKIVSAIQFNKIGDHPDVKLGYYYKSSPEAIIVSDSIPRSMDVVRCNTIVLKDGYTHVINITDWIVDTQKGKTKVYTDKKFNKKYTPVFS